MSSLIAKIFGVAASIMECINETKRKLERNVRTGCGDSDGKYKEEDDDDSLCRELKYEGDVASLCCLKSHTILKADTEFHMPIKMHVATKENMITKNNNVLVEYLHRKAQLWARRLIAILGGAIAFQK